MNFKTFMLFVFFVFYSSFSFAAMSAENSKNSVTFRQNKNTKTIEIQSKNGQWFIASNSYVGNDDCFTFQISLKIHDGKVFFLSVTGKEITFFNAGLHKSVYSFFDMELEWKNNNLYVLGEKIGGKDKIANCEKIMISYEKFKSKDMYKIFKAVVVLRNFSNKIQVLDVRNSNCWCHVKRIKVNEEAWGAGIKP
ncbi:secreted protein [Candidatus Magnetomorum sp. HK-1]|nr:secreted protein [Candidatus Magnetomorum sp. HK-1]